jgi:Flp pilus assembly protein TadG
MTKKAWHRSDRGQDIVEYALVLPLLMLLLLGIVEFGLAIWRYDTVSNAGREVARCGIIYANVSATNGIETCIDTAIAHWGLGLGLTQDDFQVTITDDEIRVQVDYEHQPITGLVIGAALPMRTVTTMQNEYN